MAQPSWVTGSGSLGTIPEGKFYRASLEAYDPDFPSDASKVKYVKIAGSLPKGIQISSSGIIEGTPVAFVQGVPNAVSQNVTSKFSIRVYTERIEGGNTVIDNLNDQTFTITVTGQDAPEFITPSGELGQYFDGQLVNKQIEFTDSDPGDTAVVSLISGELPPGVSVDLNGLIYGYIEPASEVTSTLAGWENEAWDSQPLQFNTGTDSKNYQFTLRITDGTDFNLRTFSIYVGITTADSTAYTVDANSITADTVTRAPFIANYEQNLGSFTHNNFFSYQFNGVDYNNDILNYTSTGSLPSGLSLDIDTGFLHGTLANIGLTEETHNFSIKVYKKDVPVVSNTFNFSITIVGDLNTGVTWNSNTDLGTINNGDISKFNINATSLIGQSLKYRLKQGGTYNKLPQGLQLQTTGNIVGRVQYQTFGLIDYNITADSNTSADTSTITADTNGINNITFDGGTTTFDKKFTFTIEAYSNNGQISTFKTFNILVDKKFNSPTHELSISALLSQNDRTIVDSLLQNQDIIKQDLLYRHDDPYFGVATEVSYTHAYGLSPEIINTYIESLGSNHYNKRLTLGEIKTARALNDSGNILYEVVYSNIVDSLDTIPDTVNTEIGNVHPNSLDNMRNSVIDKVGQLSLELPLWMLSKQENGKILGFTEAWVIAYTLPGQSKTVAYSISKNFTDKLNEINFVADRYILKSQFVSNWDSEDQRWFATDSTTFDIYHHGISASDTNTTCDSDTITVDLFNNSTTKTTFDNDSCVFIGVRANKTDINIKTADNINITADNGLTGATTTYQITDEYDKYLIFPKKDIINTK